MLQTNVAQSLPVGFRFMESTPHVRIPGAYNPETKMWEFHGQPSHVLMSGSATGSNASTGAAVETDINEDYD